MKKVLVVDAQGGGLGKQIIHALRKNNCDVHIIAVGTNSTATAAMLKAGADEAATGENSIKVCSKMVDYIIGPIGIVIADSMLGEITADMAVAIGQSQAKKLLIPVNHCNNIIIGYSKANFTKLIDEIIDIMNHNECK